MIFKTSLDRLASGLKAAFPSMSDTDAKGLILKGLIPYKAEDKWGPALVNRILLDSGLTEAQVTEIKNKYSTTGTSGIRCN